MMSNVSLDWDRHLWLSSGRKVSLLSADARVLMNVAMSAGDWSFSRKWTCLGSLWRIC